MDNLAELCFSFARSQCPNKDAVVTLQVNKALLMNWYIRRIQFSLSLTSMINRINQTIDDIVPESSWQFWPHVINNCLVLWSGLPFLR